MANNNSINGTVILILDDKGIHNVNLKKKKNIFAKIKNKKELAEIIDILHFKANEDSKKFNRRKIAKSFNPVIKGIINFNGDICKLDKKILIGKADEFFRLLESKYGINVFNYILNEVSQIDKFFEFEIFNYSFFTHKAVKSSLVGSMIKELNSFTSNAFLSVGLADVGTRKTGHQINIISDINTEVDLISFSWTALSPKDAAPILEEGTPVEINKSSWIRLYFQKPRIRHVVWRLRTKPDIAGIKPLLRIYADDAMLWYETLDSLSGSKYVIFPDKYELSRTYGEIGYITDSGEFIFIARSPIWPPDCMFKFPPNKKAPRKIPKKISLLGATEKIHDKHHLPFNVSGSGKLSLIL
jgi:hypothetical protein